MKIRLSSLLGVVAITALMSVTVSSQAGTLTFTIDQGASSLTLSGLIAYHYPTATDPGLTSNPQATGSQSDQWGGTLTANFSGSVLTFTGGSVITAALNPSAPYVGNPGHTSGIDNYGVWSSGLISVGSLSVTGAYQGLVLDIPAGTAQNGAAPSGMSLGFTGGALEYSYFAPALGGAGTGTSLMQSGGGTGANTAAGLVSLTTVGDEMLLILPIQFQTTGGTGRVEDWSGQIVALATVPEPSTVTVALLGLGLLAARVRARARRH
jgi:hypothetical protein